MSGHLTSDDLDISASGDDDHVLELSEHSDIEVAAVNPPMEA